MFSLPDWFRKELKLIDKDYDGYWDGKSSRWIIKWKRTEGDRTVMVVAKYNDYGQDIGYHPLDQRVLYALKKRKYLSDRPTKDILREIDDANAEVELKRQEEVDDILRQAMTTAYNTKTRVWSK